jgi:hypothetical protein
MFGHLIKLAVFDVFLESARGKRTFPNEVKTWKEILAMGIDSGSMIAAFFESTSQLN